MLDGRYWSGGSCRCGRPITAVQKTIDLWTWRVQFLPLRPLHRSAFSIAAESERMDGSPILKKEEPLSPLGFRRSPSDYTGEVGITIARLPARRGSGLARHAADSTNRALGHKDRTGMGLHSGPLRKHNPPLEGYESSRSRSVRCRNAVASRLGSCSPSHQQKLSRGASRMGAPEAIAALSRAREG